jgi:hypothetical protein
MTSSPERKDVPVDWTGEDGHSGYAFGGGSLVLIIIVVLLLIWLL